MFSVDQQLSGNPKWKAWLFRGMLFALGLVLCFWRLGDAELMEWDESYYGILASEMLETGDYINYHVGGKIEQWVGKPPLVVWAIAASYKIWGANAFGLRFPSALAMLILVMVAFEWQRKRVGNTLAFIFAASLLTVKGILGPHTGRTGDMDAFLILFCGLMVIASWEFLHLRKGKYLIVAAVFFVLAFYSKGTAVLLFLPGLGLTFLYHERSLRFMKNRSFWAAISIALLGIFSWYFLVMQFGATYEQPFRTGDNAWDVMWGYETFGRLTTFHHEAIETHSDWDFLFVALDVHVGIWFIVSSIFIVAQLVFRPFRKGFLEKANFGGLQALIFVLPAMLVVHFSANRFGWYIAPLTPFVLLIPLYAIQQFNTKWRFSGLVYGALFLVSLGIQIQQFAKIKDSSLRGPSDEKAFVDSHASAIQTLSAPIVICESGHVLYLECKWALSSTRLMFLGEIESSPNLSVAVIAKKGGFGALQSRSSLVLEAGEFEIRKLNAQ